METEIGNGKELHRAAIPLFSIQVAAVLLELQEIAAFFSAESGIRSARMVYSFSTVEESQLFRKVLIAITVLLPIAPWSSHAQSPQEGDSLSARVVTAPADTTKDLSMGMLMLRTDERLRSGTLLPFSAQFGIDTHTMFGYRVYRASVYECALRGVGSGMTMGMAAGAFGMMSGALDEREAWCIVGAAAAVGAIFGTAKSDDPEWNIRIRWVPDR